MMAGVSPWCYFIADDGWCIFMVRFLSYFSMEMLTDDQIASLMLDAQLEAVCERLAGVAQPQSPTARY
ncbi:putative SH3-binding domain protein 5-like protein [Operophtera brumata]|uniref:Putative SH3-binding domain protein 5-like protein n=1 Tax=Operophtera brumata TaxID=104452 RepID=A0A0L7L8M7_OPEBR|nr:putative SH3-binding domain protein 5-like protein [Operophtera brumata]